LITAVGKTLGSIILYFLGDKAEDLVLKRFGKFLGISHQTVENFGSKFEHKTKDIFILSFLRMMPIFPGTPVALACGMIKINFYRYVLATYIGTTLRSIIYGYIGYIGIERYQNILENANTIEAIITILGLVVAGVVFYLMRKKSMEEK
jgi:membrane protein DedA with SNARE-associated domain